MIPDSQEFERRKEQFDRRITTHEPPPTGDGAIILDSAVAVVNKYAIRAKGQGHPVEHDQYQQVIVALKARAEMGKVKYGTYLRANNGRNALVDLVQELLDAIMYSEQCRTECLFWREKYLHDEPPMHLLVGAECLEPLVELAARVISKVEVLAI